MISLQTSRLPLVRFPRCWVKLVLFVVGSWYVVKSCVKRRHSLRAVPVLRAEGKQKEKTTTEAEAAHPVPPGTDETDPSGIIDWNSVQCSHTEKASDRCDLSDAQWGIPVVLLSFGRSGSTVTWDTLAALAVRDNTGDPSSSAGGFQRSSERLGKSKEQTVRFFDEMDPREHGKCALERVLCAQQDDNRQRLQTSGSTLSDDRVPGMYGTKWKLFLESFGHVKARQALRWLAARPRIKVIHNRRNLLDVYLSKYKHSVQHVPAHCHPGDATCLEQHLAAERSLAVPTDTLLEELDYWEHATNRTLQLLRAHRVELLHVRYERLYYGDDDMEDEWNRALTYITGSFQNVTKADVLARITHVATSAALHQDKMATYDQVQALLRGTRFAKYLV